jgi:hypothetical protein
MLPSLRHARRWWCGRRERTSPFALVRPSGVLPPS